jgi:hypothetical protein
MKSLSYEKFLELIKDKPFEVVSNNSEFKNSQSFVKVKCKKCGNEWESKADNLIRVQNGCKKCLKTYIPTTEEFKTEVEKRLPNIEVLGKYVGAKKPIKCYCKICNTIWNPRAHTIRNAKKGCPVCYGRKPKDYYNDIYTLRKDLVKYFVNEKDSIGKRPFSTEIVKLKCPICGFEKEDKCSNLSNNGFSCPRCGDGISYPEKIIRNLLLQVDCDYKYQKIFNWSNRKRYDFYISKMSLICEVNGCQHYKTSFETIGGRTLEEEQENDKYKEQLAKDNGIKYYIQLDCRKSELEWIKNSVLNSELNELFDLSNIDWELCEDYYNVNLQNKVVDLWNEKNSINYIKEITKLSNTTIRLYLKNMTSLGLCDYNPQDEIKRTLFTSDSVPPITKYLRCKETRRVFNGLNEAKLHLEEYYKENNIIIDVRQLRESCKSGKEVYGLHFEYVNIVPLNKLN